ncbi:hypothetical protein GCM10020001_066520 [Nonomuraea salmonea]
MTGSGVPTAALVYKLVARETATGKLEAVAKRSVGKPSRGGARTRTGWSTRPATPRPS